MLRTAERAKYYSSPNDFSLPARMMVFTQGKAVKRTLVVRNKPEPFTSPFFKKYVIETGISFNVKHEAQLQAKPFFIKSRK